MYAIAAKRLLLCTMRLEASHEMGIYTYIYISYTNNRQKRTHNRNVCQQYFPFTRDRNSQIFTYYILGLYAVHFMRFFLCHIIEWNFCSYIVQIMNYPNKPLDDNFGCVIWILALFQSLEEEEY